MGLFNGPPVTDAQRDLVAMTDARTREWYLEAEITMLNMRIAELEAALKRLLDDIADYERINNLYPKPGKEYCWESVVNARKVLGEKND